MIDALILMTKKEKRRERTNSGWKEERMRIIMHISPAERRGERRDKR